MWHLLNSPSKCKLQLKISPSKLSSRNSIKNIFLQVELLRKMGDNLGLVCGELFSFTDINFLMQVFLD